MSLNRDRVVFYLSFKSVSGFSFVCLLWRWVGKGFTM